ncbi:carboxypeptidase-like regulatory domain-containing protein [Ekhidna sp.]
MFHSAFTLALALISFFSVPDPYSVKGIIRDKESNEPIPFAHVVIDDVINISNIDGEFIISIADLESEDAQIEISYMGYDSYSKSVQDIEGYHTIFLQPSITTLDEVVVRTGPFIMEKVFNRFHINYSMERQHMVGFYKESMSNWKEFYYVAEGIMDIYSPSNIDKLQYPLVRPLRTRKKVFKELDIINDVLGGNASDMAHSSIWRTDSFLSTKNRKDYDYFYSGATSIGSKEVIIVEFEPRKNSKGNTKGKLYIDEESLAIIKIEYFPVIDDWSHWESVSWVEEYEKKNGLYEMISVSFTGTSTNHEFDYNALLVINESKAIDEFPEDIYLLTQHDSFFEEAQDNFSDTFWEGFNFMKLGTKASANLEDTNRN